MTRFFSQVVEKAAKPKKKGRWGLKIIGAGSLVVAGYTVSDSLLHPRPKKELVEVLSPFLPTPLSATNKRQDVTSPDCLSRSSSAEGDSICVVK